MRLFEGSKHRLERRIARERLSEARLGGLELSFTPERAAGEQVVCSTRSVELDRPIVPAYGVAIPAACAAQMSHRRVLDRPQLGGRQPDRFPECRGRRFVPAEAGQHITVEVPNEPMRGMAFEIELAASGRSRDAAGVPVFSDAFELGSSRGRIGDALASFEVLEPFARFGVRWSFVEDSFAGAPRITQVSAGEVRLQEGQLGVEARRPVRGGLDERGDRLFEASEPRERPPEVDLQPGRVRGEARRGGRIAGGRIADRLFAGTGREGIAFGLFQSGEGSAEPGLGTRIVAPGRVEAAEEAFGSVTVRRRQGPDEASQPSAGLIVSAGQDRSRSGL